MRALTGPGQVDEVGFLDDERPVEPCLAERRLEARDPRFDLVGRNHRRRVCRTVILENGLIRTMDPSLPTARALAIAGDRIVGGVGVHETALASPETVDLAGLTVLPGFTDSHVHFAQWSLAQRQVRLEGVASLDEAVARVAEVARGRRPGRWLRGLGWRSGDWHPQVEPTRQALDAVTGDIPTALMAKDGHSIWINSAGLAPRERRPPGAGRRGRAGRARRTDRRPPRGVRLALPRDATSSPPTTSGSTRCAPGSRSRTHAASLPCTTRTAGWGSSAWWQTLRDEGSLSLRVWQSLPRELLPEIDALGLRSGIGDDLLRIGYIKVFMDGTLGSKTARLLDGSGVEITSREQFEDIVRRAARAGFPVGVHAIGDQANRDALDGFEAAADEWRPTGLRPRIEHAQLVAERGLPPVRRRSGSPRRSSSATARPTATSRTTRGPA